MRQPLIRHIVIKPLPFCSNRTWLSLYAQRRSGSCNRRAGLYNTCFLSYPQVTCTTVIADPHESTYSFVTSGPNPLLSSCCLRNRQAMRRQ
jgi:hypothetical protein